MMQAEPNPLQRELARMQPAGPHPDADLLSAFAEGSLLEREREEILAHLAGCAECRELLNVAGGAAVNPAAQSKLVALPRPTPSPVRTWLPWASVAAAILLACTAGLVYRQRLEMRKAGTENSAQTSETGQPMLPVLGEHSAEYGSTSSKPNPGKSKVDEPAPEEAPMASAGACLWLQPKSAPQRCGLLLAFHMARRHRRWRRDSTPPPLPLQS